MEIRNIAKEVIKVESKEILNLINYIDENFNKIIEIILTSKGKLIVSGMGKSGIIGRKIAATLASTGTPSFFLHPAEAYHGDLGMIEKDDIVLLISNSGETDEILKIIPFLENQGNITISMTGDPNSTLAKNTTYHLNIAVKEEACPLQLAPTSSTTAALVMGDVIAVSLMKLKDFKKIDFAKFHPGGSLGKKLLTKIKDKMKTNNLPVCSKDTNIIDVIHIVTKGESGLVVVLENNKIIGVITDGDIRRTMENRQEDFFNLKAKDLMTTNPKIINQNEKIIKASEMIKQYSINALIVVDNEERFVGIIKAYDLGI